LFVKRDPHEKRFFIVEVIWLTGIGVLAYPRARESGDPVPAKQSRQNKKEASIIYRQEKPNHARIPSW
jgi:hypothetical protein